MTPHLPPTTVPTDPSAPTKAPHLNPLLGLNGHPSRPPASSRRRGSRRWPFYLAGATFLGLMIAGVVFAAGSARELFPTLFASSRPDLITHKLQKEYLQVTVVERGALESADNKDVVCKVKAGSKGTFASTIRWVIDDGSMVVKNQLLMELDDSSLQEQYRTQSIAVEKAKAEWVKATEDYTIQAKENESLIAAAVAAVDVAKLNLDKFLGIRADPELGPLGALSGAPATLVERGDYRARLDDLSSQLKLAQSDLEAFRERMSWAERSVRLGYLTASQAKVEESKYASGQDKVAKLSNDKYVLEKFQRQVELTTLTSALRVAEIDLEKTEKQAIAKLNQAESLRRTNYSVYQQELEKLKEIEDQIKECRILAPQDGMVVYYKERSRYSSNQEGLIQVGVQVKEGQKLMQIPDLKRMQVNTKVHEALVNRIRGDDYRSTGYFESLRAALLTAADPLTRLVTHSEQAQAVLREQSRDKEYILASRGQSARIRVDAAPNKLYQGHVKSVAAVAAQQDWSSSDVRVYQTLVTIDGEVEGLKPDMSAEVTILVDPPTEPVLCVPIQAVVGGAEGGSKRSVYVMTPTGPQERDVVLGLFNDRMVEVREGLAEGDEVVLNPKVLLGDSIKTREPSELSSGGRPGGPPRPGGGGPGGEKGKGGKGGAGQKGGGGMKGPPAGGGDGGGKN